MSKGDSSAKDSDIITVEVLIVAGWLLFPLDSVRVNDQYWSLGMVHYVFCYRAEEGVFEPFAAVGSHDNQIYVFLFHCLDNLFTGIAHGHYSIEVGTIQQVLITELVQHHL
jgi:hypothetical protein